jgi:hypothetical protein
MRMRIDVHIGNANPRDPCARNGLNRAIAELSLAL